MHVNAKGKNRIYFSLVQEIILKLEIIMIVISFQHTDCIMRPYRHSNSWLIKDSLMIITNNIQPINANQEGGITVVRW